MSKNVKKTCVLSLYLFLIIQVVNADEFMGIYYFNGLFGHVHQSASRYSQALTTISCGHPIKVLQNPSTVDKSDGWLQVQVASYKGYLKKSTLSSEKVICFQDRYPVFLEELQLDITDLYYWGKLYDQYLLGRSKIK